MYLTGNPAKNAVVTLDNTASITTTGSGVISGTFTFYHTEFGDAVDRTPARHWILWR